MSAPALLNSAAAHRCAVCRAAVGGVKRARLGRGWRFVATCHGETSVAYLAPEAVDAKKRLTWFADGLVPARGGWVDRQGRVAPRWLGKKLGAPSRVERPHAITDDVLTPEEGTP